MTAPNASHPARETGSSCSDQTWESDSHSPSRASCNELPIVSRGRAGIGKTSTCTVDSFPSSLAQGSTHDGDQIVYQLLVSPALTTTLSPTFSILLLSGPVRAQPDPASPTFSTGTEAYKPSARWPGHFITLQDQNVPLANNPPSTGGAFLSHSCPHGNKPQR